MYYKKPSIKAINLRSSGKNVRNLREIVIKAFAKELRVWIRSEQDNGKSRMKIISELKKLGYKKNEIEKALQDCSLTMY